MDDRIKVTASGSLHCPFCDQMVELYKPGFYNTDRYVTANVVTASCGHAFHLQPQVVIHAVPYQGDRDTDGWGNAITPPPTSK